MGKWIKTTSDQIFIYMDKYWGKCYFDKFRHTEYKGFIEIPYLYTRMPWMHVSFPENIHRGGYMNIFSVILTEEKPPDWDRCILRDFPLG